MGCVFSATVLFKGSSLLCLQIHPYVHIKRRIMFHPRTSMTGLGNSISLSYFRYNDAIFIRSFKNKDRWKAWTEKVIPDLSSDKRTVLCAIHIGVKWYLKVLRKQKKKQWVNAGKTLFCFFNKCTDTLTWTPTGSHINWFYCSKLN